MAWTPNREALIRALMLVQAVPQELIEPHQHRFEESPEAAVAALTAFSRAYVLTRLAFERAITKWPEAQAFLRDALGRHMAEMYALTQSTTMVATADALGYIEAQVRVTVFEPTREAHELDITASTPFGVNAHDIAKALGVSVVHRLFLTTGAVLYIQPAGTAAPVNVEATKRTVHALGGRRIIRGAAALRDLTSIGASVPHHADYTTH